MITIHEPISRFCIGVSSIRYNYTAHIFSLKRIHGNTNRHVHDFKFNLFLSYSLADSWKGTNISWTIFQKYFQMKWWFIQQCTKWLSVFDSVCGLGASIKIFHILRTNFERIYYFKITDTALFIYLKWKACDKKEEHTK